MSVSEKPRVLFLINGFSIGGGERVFLSQANELVRRGWDIYVATLFFIGDLRQELAVHDDHFVCLNARTLFDVRALYGLFSFIRSKRIDVLYTTLNEANTAGRVVKIFLPHARLYTREANMADIKPTVHKVSDIFLGFLSHRIIAVSKAVSNSIGRYAPWLRKRTLVLYNGIRTPPEPAHHVVGPTIRLLSVGSLTPKKDHAILIAAMKRLPDYFHLTIVGDGALKPALEEHARNTGLASRIVFLGAVQPGKMTDLYLSHDVFVLPSQREGCPNVVSEAQSLALPVVAFDIPGMREFVDDTCGAVVSMRDPDQLAAAIGKLCASRESMRTAGENGYRKVTYEREFVTHIDALTSLFLE